MFDGTLKADEEDRKTGLLVAVTEGGEVVTLTAATETNLCQGNLETKVAGTKGDLTVTETESNEATPVRGASNH